jgi:hypothetical protein
MSDRIERDLVEGVKPILDMKQGERAQELYCMELIRGLVPVLIVFTKFDLLVSRVDSDITRERLEDSRARAHTIYEDLCRSQFHKDPKDVPAVIFSGNCFSVFVPRELL